MDARILLPFRNKSINEVSVLPKSVDVWVLCRSLCKSFLYVPCIFVLEHKKPSPTCVESTVFQNVIVWCGIKNSLLQISGIVISLSSFSSLSHPGHRQVHVHKMVILTKIQADFQWPDLMENGPPGKFLLTGDIYKSAAFLLISI